MAYKARGEYDQGKSEYLKDRAWFYGYQVQLKLNLQYTQAL